MSPDFECDTLQLWTSGTSEYLGILSAVLTKFLFFFFSEEDQSQFRRNVPTLCRFDDCLRLS